MLKINIDTKSAQTAVDRLEKDLKTLGSQTERSSKEFKRLEDRLRKKVGMAQAKKSVDAVTRSLKMSRLETIKFKMQVGDLGGAFRTLGGTLNRARKSLMGMKTMMAGIGIAVILGDIIRVGAKFEKTMAGVKGVTGASAKEFEALTGIAKKLGETTEFTASQAAEGLKFLAMAGFEVEKAIGALPGVLDLATAGQLDLGESADIVSNALTAMRLNVDELGMVNDVFIKTITTANTDVRMLAESFKYSAPLAAGLGYNIVELSSWIGLLGNAGIQGSMAGTQINAIFGKLAKTFKKYGESAKDATGRTKGITDAVELLERKGATASEVLKDYQMRGGRAMLAFMGMGSKAMKEYEKLIEDSEGANKRLADTMRATTIGAFKELLSAMEGVKISAFEEQTGELNEIIKELTKTIRDNKDEIVSFLNGLATLTYGVGSGFVALASGFGKLFKATEIKYPTTGIEVMEIKLKEARQAAEDFEKTMRSSGLVTEEQMKIGLKPYNDEIERYIKLVAKAKVKFLPAIKESTYKDSWQLKDERSPKDLAYYENKWAEAQRNADKLMKEIESAEKADSKYRQWQKQRERDATHGTSKSIAEAEKLNKKYYADIAKQEKKSTDAIKKSKEEQLKFAEEQYEAEQKALEESLSAQQKIYDNFLEGVQGNFVDFFEELYSGQLDSWENLLDGMKSTFIKMLAEITAKQFTANIIASIGGAGGGGSGILGWVKKAFGLAGTGGAVGMTSGVGGSIAGGTYAELGIGGGGMYGGGVGAGSAGAGTAMGLGTMAAGIGGVGLTGYMGYKMIEAQRQRDARFLFTKLTRSKDYQIQTRDMLDAGIPGNYDVTRTPWEAEGAYSESRRIGERYSGPTEIIGKSYGRSSEKKARKPVEEAIDKMYDDAIEMANMYDKITKGEVGEALTLTPHKEKFDVKDAEKELARLAEHWNDIIWDVFDEAFEDLGFKSMESLEKALVEGSGVIGTALQQSIESGSFLLFKASIAEQIYNSITDSVTEAMLESQMMQQALLPVYGQMNRAMEGAMAGGDFDIGVYREGMTGIGSLLSTSFSDMKPAFEEIADLGKMLREMFVGTFADGGTIPRTGLAMVHEGETISPEGGGGMALTINANVITTDNVRGWMREMLEDQENFREGRPLQRFDLQTAGIDVS